MTTEQEAQVPKEPGRTGKKGSKRKAPSLPIAYKGALLMHGSDAYKLHALALKEGSGFARLDKHLAQLDRNAAALREGRLSDYVFIEVALKSEGAATE